MGEETKDEFKPVTFEKERKRALENLALTKPSCSMLVRNEVSFPCTVKEEADGLILLEIPVKANGLIRDGDVCEVMFSLNDGQYLFRSKAQTMEKNRVGLPVSGDVRRLQRRNNFRVPTTSAFKGKFQIFDGGAKQELALVDLSVSGARARWPTGAVKPVSAKTYRAVLSFEQNEIELSVSIKTIATDGPHATVGFEFKPLGAADERAVLFLCLQLQRQQTPII